jgi:hypothetical protein
MLHIEPGVQRIFEESRGAATLVQGLPEQRPIRGIRGVAFDRGGAGDGDVTIWQRSLSAL